jgi:hypothetical protein
MGAVSGTDVTSVRSLTAATDFGAKRTALFRLLRHRVMPHDQMDQIQSFFHVVDAFVSLRNDIVHSVWEEGAPQSSVWPLRLTHGPLSAVQPAGQGDWVRYSLEDLNDISQRFAMNYAGLQRYIAGVGLAPAV